MSAGRESAPPGQHAQASLDDPEPDLLTGI
jgi:hypothetical protein